jgi:hypothetical protein
VSLLTITQSLILKVLSSKPAAAASSSDPKILQAVEYINEAGQELAARHTWQALSNEATFVTVATESQGSIQTIAGPPFAFVVNETMWNRTLRRPLYGPKSASEWQLLKAMLSANPLVSYRVRANQLLFWPIPPAGQSVYFEWISRNWMSTADGVTFSNHFTADDQVSLLDERVLTLDALWRFKRANQLAYEEDYDKAEKAIDDLITRDGGKPRLNLSGAPQEQFPAVLVPAGNWGLP